MSGKVFEVRHKVVGNHHVFYVPAEDPDARGAGLIVSHADEETARGMLDAALDTAKRHGRVPQDAALAQEPEAPSGPSI